jgi:hypothetical protein
VEGTASGFLHSAPEICELKRVPGGAPVEMTSNEGDCKRGETSKIRSFL